MQFNSNNNNKCKKIKLMNEIIKFKTKNSIMFGRKDQF